MQEKKLKSKGGEKRGITKKWNGLRRGRNDGIIKGERWRVCHAAHAGESWSDYKSQCLFYISVQIFWQYIACFPSATWQLAPHEADRCTVHKNSICNLSLKKKPTNVIEPIKFPQDLVCKNLLKNHSRLKNKPERRCRGDSAPLAELWFQVRNTVTLLICKYGETNANSSSRKQSSFLGFIC